MSNPAVREAMREAWSVRVPTIPYYDTINVMPVAASLPSVWATMIFAEPTKSKISIGSEQSCYREVGVVGVVIMTRTGSGDTPSGDAYNLVNTAFRHFVGAGGYLQVITVQPPKDSLNDTPSKSEFNKTVIEIDYSFDSYE